LLFGGHRGGLGVTVTPRAGKSGCREVGLASGIGVNVRRESEMAGSKIYLVQV
jgi:hypothetical protein